jgi:IS30 family transposase
MPKLTEEKKALVDKLARDKKTIRQIAEETGVSKTTIGTFLKNKKDYMEVYTTDSPTAVSYTHLTLPTKLL